jgi:hypothetical protein
MMPRFFMNKKKEYASQYFSEEDSLGPVSAIYFFVIIFLISLQIKKNLILRKCDTLVPRPCISTPYNIEVKVFDFFFKIDNLLKNCNIFFDFKL